MYYVWEKERKIGWELGSGKSRTHFDFVKSVVFPGERVHHHTIPYQQIFVISFPLLPEDKRKDKRHLFFIFCFLLSSLWEHWQQHCKWVRVNERMLWVEPIQNSNQKLYDGVIHASCEISHYRNVTDALYTHFFPLCGHSARRWWRWRQQQS